jgi:hypothetical protein
MTQAFESMYFIERLIKEIFGTQVLLSELQNENNVVEYITPLLIGFNDYLIFLTSDNCGDDSFKCSQVKLISFIINAFRVLIKEGYLKREVLYNVLEREIKSLQNGEIIINTFLYNKIDSLIGEILFLMLILDLIDTDEGNNMITNIYLYISIAQYIRELYFEYYNNNNSVNQNINNKITYDDLIIYYSIIYNKNNNNNTTRIINEYQNELTKNYIRKMFTFIHIAKQISSLLNTPIQHDINNQTQLTLTLPNDIYTSMHTQFITSINSEFKPTITAILNSFKSQLQLPKQIPLNILQMSAISCAKFSLIALPKNVQLLFEKIAGTPCAICNKHTNLYCICLICGKQMCFNVKCLTDYGGVTTPSLYYHIEICSGGNAIVAASDTSNVYIINNKLLAGTKCFMYRDKFGDFAQGRTISDEYVLSEDDYNKAMKLYVTRNTVTNNLVMVNYN